MSEPKGDWHYYKVLFPMRARLGMLAMMIGTVMVGLIDTASLLLLVPLLALIGGQDATTGPLGFVHRMFGSPEQQTFLVILVVLMLGGFIIKDLATLLFRWWMLGFSARRSAHTSGHILRYFLYSPYEVFLRRGMPDMLRSIKDAVDGFYGRSVNGAMAAFSEAVSILTVLCALVFIMQGSTLIVAAYFALIGSAYIWLVRPYLQRSAAQLLESGREALGAAIHAVGGIQEIQIRHAQPHFIRRYRKAALEVAQATRVASFLGEAPKYLLEVAFILGLGGLILLTKQGDLLLTVGLLAAAAYRLLPAMTRLVSSLAIVRSGEPFRKVLLQELRNEDAQGSPASAPITTAHLPFDKSIEFEDVWFTYSDGTEPVLSGVTLSIPAGASIALVGGSGSGKTTLANLLLGLLKPTKGRILVDGVDIAERMIEWQNNIAFVPQEVFHMDLSMSRNITFNQFEHEIDTAKLAEAIQKAQLDALIDSLPHGLDTTLGDGAVRLSGGQRQRIGIARALYRDPKLLVLDEATSALDNEIERQITETLSALHGEITMLIIAHRLSTVRDADQVVLLDSGKVAGMGTFAELEATNAEFAHLVELGRLASAEDNEGLLG